MLNLKKNTQAQFNSKYIRVRSNFITSLHMYQLHNTWTAKLTLKHHTVLFQPHRSEAPSLQSPPPVKVSKICKHLVDKNEPAFC